MMTEIIDNEEVTLHLVLGNPGMANLFNDLYIKTVWGMFAEFDFFDVQGRILVITNWSHQ